jgi:two-component system, LuxR family, sensor kinase FixL
MSWVTIIWSMTASACLTMGALNLLVWSKQRTAWANLLFSVAAFGAAAFAYFELSMLHAQTPAEYGAALRWGHVAIWFMAVSVVVFLRLYLHAGRLWLAWAACGLRTLALLLNFMSGQNINYLEIDSLIQIPLFGESVAIAHGVHNPYTWIPQASSFLTLVFGVDATITVWRRGEHRKALVVGGGLVLFQVIAFAESLLVIRGIVRAPITLSLPFLGLVVAMGYELSREVLDAAITARELRENETRMTLAMDAANLGLWVRDIARGNIWASDKWRQLFGFAPSEPLTFDHIMQRVHPEDRESLERVLARANAGGGQYETEFRLLLPDGRVQWIRSRGGVEFDDKGKPLVARGISRDITAIKKSEQETLLLRQEIAHAGRVSLMGQLASALAHEISQPLGAILRNAEAADLFLQDPSPDLDEIRAILADIRADDQRAGMVIDRMRALLKRHELDARPVAVSEVVADVVSLAKADALSRQVKLSVDVANALLRVRGDRVHLQQVLLNLILNAIDALAESSGQVRSIDIAARFKDAQWVEVTVSDTGPGIPVEVLPLLFDPFYTTKPSGMGIGLSISRTIIEAHGGRIWAENNAVGGATFRFTLPVADDAAAS